MPGPPRRLKVILLLVLLIVLISFYITTSAHTTRTSPFYTRTQDALAAQRAAKEESLGHTDNSATDRSSEKSDLQDTPIDAKPGSVGGDEIRKGLKEAEEAAKAAADRKGDEFHGESGRERAAQVQAAMKEKDEEKKKVEPETEEQSRVKEELNAILKRSPVIIFSKSYCPFSRKAKDILLLRYTISPTPYVVELNEHPLGAQLQAELASSTGRKTVPNVLINGKSIGGGDDVEKLHLDGTLIETVKSMGGKRMEVSKNEAEEKRKRRR